jgi:hypothetical protein
VLLDNAIIHQIALATYSKAIIHSAAQHLLSLKPAVSFFSMIKQQVHPKVTEGRRNSKRWT